MFLARDIDSDGELEVSIFDSNDWLTKSMAVSVISHLAKVFKLEVIIEAVELYNESNVGEKK
ncbi:MAG: hypothetical protein KAT71_08395 [Gammaproteobacteria bacterium]|nr:hypothetical protein [Gammaproteobacteria bacterium]